MAFQKNDFLEIEFTGKTKDKEIFDTNKKDDLKKIPNAKSEQAKPFVFPLGQEFFLKGIEDFLIGKELGKHKIELSPENAFGLREPKLIQLMPSNVFKTHKINPFPGAVFNFDGRMGKVLSVSGGRIRVDFNHPLAGKEVTYDLEVKRKVEDIKEKVKSLLELFLRKEFPFEIIEKKLLVDVEKSFAEFLILFKDKFKEILDLELEIKKEAQKTAKNHNNP